MVKDTKNLLSDICLDKYMITEIQKVGIDEDKGESRYIVTGKVPSGESVYAGNVEIVNDNVNVSSVYLRQSNPEAKEKTRKDIKDFVTINLEKVKLLELNQKIAL